MPNYAKIAKGMSNLATGANESSWQKALASANQGQEVLPAAQHEAKGGAIRMQAGGSFVLGQPKSFMDRLDEATPKAIKMPKDPLAILLNAGYEGYKHFTGKDPIGNFQKELDRRLNPENDTGSETINKFDKLAKGGGLPRFDKGGAAFGVMPQMKPKRAHQDREASKNVPVDLARGFVSGVLGAPGDLESIIRMLPYLNEETMLPTSEDVEKKLPFKSDTPVSRAATGLGQVGGGFYTGPASPLRAIGSLPKAFKHGAEEFAKATVAGAPHVIKSSEKGSNWIKDQPRLGSLKTKTFVGETPAERIPKHEELLKDPNLNQDQRNRVQSMLDVTKQEAALDQWVDSNLTNYVKNEMATPNDPIRLFIEKREQEIAGKYAKDLERAKRMEERAAQEIDPRRKANLTRQSKKMYEEADLEREYAMQHTSHLPKDLQNPERMWTPDDLAELRKREGFPEEGMGKSPNSQMWEQMADQSVYPNKAGDIQQFPAQQAKRKEALDEYLAYERELDDKLVSYLYKKGFDDNSTQALLKMPSSEKANILNDKKLKKLFDAIPPYQQNEHFLEIAGKENPWISKLDPKTNVYSGEASSLDFDHVIDVLKQDLAAKRIRPDQLNKLSIEQAVRRTTEFDREMADKMRAAVIKNQEGFPTHKDYGEEGYKWIELAPPKELPAGYRVIQSDMGEGFKVLDAAGNEAVATASRPTNNMGHTNIPFHKTEEEAIADALKYDKRLEEALKYEGDTMGHCVGGYCPDVIAGKSRIYSLRDAKGQPHVTVETRKGDFSKAFDNLSQEEQAAVRKVAGSWASDEDLLSAMKQVVPDKANIPETIVQIKGKQNAKPKEDYIPYVQDFVRSGNWSGVGDFKNTDLIDANAVRKAGWDMKGVDKKYFTKQEYDDFLLAELNRVEGNKDGGAIHMQAGGVAGGINLLKKLGTAGAKLTKAEEAALRAPNVMNYADPLAPATMRMSEALGNAGAEGKTLNFTEADRSRVFGSNRGGVGFSGLQHYSEPHKEANTVWGFGNKLTADKKVKQNDPEKNLWTTFVGAPTQHKSNTVVLQDAVKEFQDAVKTGNVHPEQIKLMNNRIRAAKDEKTGSLLFDPKYDLTDPSALSVANSFARRSAIGDVLLGEGVKGQMRRKAFKEEHGSPPWKDAGKIEDILKRETDPDLVNAGTFDVGNRLFVMDNGVIHRPDLNVAFPYQVTGNDLGMKFELTPKEIAMRDWMKQYEAPRGKTNKVTPPSYMDLARNNPSQFVDEDYLTFLQKQGKKDGGSIQAKPFHDFDQIMSRAKGGAVDKPKTWLHALNNHQHKMACGGSVCDNTTPDITDSGNINYGGQYAQGGIV